jgi:hypothetical protein
VSEDDVRIAEQLDAILRAGASGEEKMQTDVVLRPNAPKKGNGLEVESSKPLYLN